MGVRLQPDRTDLRRARAAAADPGGRRHGRFESDGGTEFVAPGTASGAKISQRAAAERARPTPRVGLAQGRVMKDLVLGARSSLRTDGLLRRCAGLGRPILTARRLRVVMGVQQT